jgi:hypothetical protein
VKLNLALASALQDQVAIQVESILLEDNQVMAHILAS